jgi:hypothetical protein
VRIGKKLNIRHTCGNKNRCLREREGFALHSKLQR